MNLEIMAEIALQTSTKRKTIAHTLHITTLDSLVGLMCYKKAISDPFRVSYNGWVYVLYA
jgi:hypothetical protein